MKHNIKYKAEKGSVMLMVLMTFSVILILGTSIFTVVKSENKLTGFDSKNQSAYYIAESGINYKLRDIIVGIDEIKTEIEDEEEVSPGLGVRTYEERFFEKFNNRYVNKNYTISNFKINGGDQPQSNVRITLESSKKYKIESTGIIGDSKRKVSSIITLGYVEPEVPDNPIIEDLLTYTTAFSSSGSVVDGEGGTAVLGSFKTEDINGGAIMNVSTIYFDGDANMDGGSASFGSQNSPETIYVNGNLNFWGGTRNVWGDVRVKGNFKLKDAHMHGNVYVNGNVELGWTPTIHKKIYYTGTLTYPPNGYPQDLVNKCEKVASVNNWEVPLTAVSLKDDLWYSNNGYDIKGNVNSTVPDNAKWLVNNYDYTDWPQWNVNENGKLENIIIVSKGNIRINTATECTGVLIAPNGTVELTHGGTIFRGIIVSNNSIKISGGGSKIYFKKLEDMFSNSAIPFNFGSNNTGSSGGDSDDDDPDDGNTVNSGGITLNLSNIKEN